jgi:hypothetical protein
MVCGLKAERGTYLGVLLISLATLAFELLLTRIFSVTLWNSYAFIAVSLAMFGMTLGAVAVQVLPGVFRREQTWRWMSAACLLMGICMMAALEVHRTIRIPPTLSFRGLPLLVVTYLVASTPFICSGIVLTLALTRFGMQVSRLYAADLCGAALGCVLLGFMLRAADGPTAVYATAAVACGAAIAFAADGEIGRLKRIGAIAGIAIAAFVVANTIEIHSGQLSLVRLKWTKDPTEPAPIYERWNSYSRVNVYDTQRPLPPVGWGFGGGMPPQPEINWMWLDIDASAGTVLTQFDGDLTKHGYFAWDVTNVAHQLKNGSDVLIIGAGGGRDILSSLYFHEKSVVGLEMNKSVYNAVTNTFGDYTGHLDRIPNVRIINDEARSYLARTPLKYDLIQLSLVDTWAATAAGAFVLSENALYTSEGWDLFLSRLQPGGMISASRWFAPDRPHELHRLAALAAQALRRRGVSNPEAHILICRSLDFTGPANAASVDPFTAEELAKFNNVAAQRGFRILFSPTQCDDSVLRTVIESPDIAAATADLNVNLVPPTDNKPFFFDNSRIRNLFDAQMWNSTRVQGGLLMLLGLLGVVMVLSMVFILAPLAIRTLKSGGPGNLPGLKTTAYFALIGVAFMIVEISQMERLTVLLGHPTYCLTVALFSLLISSGIGSFCTAAVDANNLFSAGRLRMIGLMATLIVLGIVSPAAIESFQGGSTPVRIAVALALFFPVGFFMGMAFPLGMKWAAGQDANYTAWLWGVNGAASVCASVLAMIISMMAGISVAWWCGTALYLAAATVLLTGSRPAAGEGRESDVSGSVPIRPARGLAA